MTKDISRAASSIYAAMMASVTPTCDPACVPVSTCDMARAAILALIPPTDEMVEAAALAVYIDETKHTGQSWDGCPDTDRDYFCRQARLALTAALRAAAGEKP